MDHATGNTVFVNAAGAKQYMNTQHQADSRLINGLYWFTNDLRIEDNPALAQACKQVENLICVYILNPSWFQGNRYNLQSMGSQRLHFLQESLLDLEAALAERGQQLIVIRQHPLDAIPSLITQYNIDAVYSSENAGYNENQQWLSLKQGYPQLQFRQYPTHTLFEQSKLPFALNALPESFTKFRKRVEPITIEPELEPQLTATS